MEYFSGSNIASVLSEIPASEIRTLISQIATAAKFLADLSFAHRDIKPENVGLSPDMKSAKVLDLGVIRPFDLSNITDEGDQSYFVGTLQYSPPELLFREEEQSVEAWRAITFYQLGGILHDLLMRKPLFEDFKNPYARLVRAVEREIPRIDSSAADADLRLLAQDCLAKVPGQRLDTVTWEDFSRPKVADPMEAARTFMDALEARDPERAASVCAEDVQIELPGGDSDLKGKEGARQLVRMAPKTWIPAHDHGEAEQCLVLEGSVTSDGVTAFAGDFTYMPAGSSHHPLYSEDGCLLLIAYT